MAQVFEIRVTGIQDVWDRLERVNTLVAQKKAVARALRKAMAPTKETAARLAPDDPETSTSRIRENVKISVVEQTATGAMARTGPEGSGFVGKFAELGTSRQMRRPWLGPAFEQTKERDIGILRAEMEAEIEKAFG